MKQYSYTDLLNSGWISPAHGLSDTTIWMVIAAAVLLTLALAGRNL